MSKKVLIIGEWIKDIHVYCRVDRISPDKFVPVLCPIRTEENQGGATNCYENIRTMFPELDIHHISQETPIIKTRYLEHSTNQHYIRVDECDKVESPLTIIKLVEVLNDRGLRLSDFAAIGISDYGKGFITKDLVKEISSNFTTFLDTKHILDKSWSENVYCVKINNKEYQTNLAANSNFAVQCCKNLIITKGGEGALLNGKMFKSHAVEVVDTSGAGDSFFATIIGCYVNGEGFDKSIPLANKICGLLAARRGVNIMTNKDLTMARSQLECLI